METPANRSGVAAVLFTDLVVSTELMAALGDTAFDRLRNEHLARLSRAVEAHGGTVVKNAGDGLMATFGSSVEAVAAAVGSQQAAAEATHLRIEAPTWLARTRLEWARMLLARRPDRRR